MMVREQVLMAPKVAKTIFRRSTAVLAFATALYAQAGRGGPAAGAPFDIHDISGYWELPFDGRSVPHADLASGVTPAVLAEQAKKDMKAIRWCNSLGMPFLMDSGRPLDIRQGKNEVIIAPEANASPRHLYFNHPHQNPETFDPTTVGDSIAHWEGNALVVDTVGFDGNRGVTAVPGGGFRTSASHLIERFRLLSGGAVLSVTFTWEDPKTYARPHTYEFRYARIAGKYEPRQALGCNPYDEERTNFVSHGPVLINWTAVPSQ
jgi:hypothetical protein